MMSLLLVMVDGSERRGSTCLSSVSTRERGDHSAAELGVREIGGRVHEV